MRLRVGYLLKRFKTWASFLRSDFATLPFQAVECYLANVMPLEGNSAFSLHPAGFFVNVKFCILVAEHS